MPEFPADRQSRTRLGQARRLLAIAQTGLHYATGSFDRERYEEIASIAHNQIAELASLDTGKVAELFSLESGYANPKLDVRCAVFDEVGRILLVREAADGLWSIPGGWADVGVYRLLRMQRRRPAKKADTRCVSNVCWRSGI